MEKECPKCGSIMSGETPDEPWFVCYACEECGYEENEDITGDLINQAEYQVGDR